MHKILFSVNYNIFHKLKSEMCHYHTLGYVACCAGQCGGPQSLHLDVYLHDYCYFVGREMESQSCFNLHFPVVKR